MASRSSKETVTLPDSVLKYFQGKEPQKNAKESQVQDGVKNMVNDSGKNPIPSNLSLLKSCANKPARAQMAYPPKKKVSSLASKMNGQGRTHDPVTSQVLEKKPLIITASGPSLYSRSPYQGELLLTTPVNFHREQGRKNFGVARDGPSGHRAVQGDSTRTESTLTGGKSNKRMISAMEGSSDATLNPTKRIRTAEATLKPTGIERPVTRAIPNAAPDTPLKTTSTERPVKRAAPNAVPYRPYKKRLTVRKTQNAATQPASGMQSVIKNPLPTGSQLASMKSSGARERSTAIGNSVAKPKMWPLSAYETTVRGEPARPAPWSGQAKMTSTRVEKPENHSEWILGAATGKDEEEEISFEEDLGSLFEEEQGPLFVPETPSDRVREIQQRHRAPIRSDERSAVGDAVLEFNENRTLRKSPCPKVEERGGKNRGGRKRVVGGFIITESVEPIEGLGNFDPESTQAGDEEKRRRLEKGKEVGRSIFTEIVLPSIEDPMDFTIQAAQGDKTQSKQESKRKGKEIDRSMVTDKIIPDTTIAQPSANLDLVLYRQAQPSSRRRVASPIRSNTKPRRILLHGGKITQALAKQAGEGLSLPGKLEMWKRSVWTTRGVQKSLGRKN